MALDNAEGGRLRGRRAVITGGGSGLGLETARLFVAEGAEVVVTGSNPARVEHAAASLGAGATGVVADVRSLPDLDRLAEAVRERWGGLDVLVANAGVGTFGPMVAVTEEQFDWQFGVNVKGLFFTVQKLAPLMGEGGSVVLTASAVNAKGSAGGSVYFATKAAVRSLARSFAAEFGPRGIRVNALSPGLVPTNFAERSGNPPEDLEAFGSAVIGATPLGRPGRPDEIAEATLFLASGASGYVTAADLVVDGGYMNV